MSYDHQKPKFAPRVTVYGGIYTEPLIWQETPKWHPRRVLWKQNWRRFLPDYSGFAYEYEGNWQYMTDHERATDALREEAGLPDATLDDVYH